MRPQNPGPLERCESRPNEKPPAALMRSRRPFGGAGLSWASLVRARGRSLTVPRGALSRGPGCSRLLDARGGPVQGHVVEGLAGLGLLAARRGLGGRSTGGDLDGLGGIEDRGEL